MSVLEEIKERSDAWVEFFARCPELKAAFAVTILEEKVGYPIFAEPKSGLKSFDIQLFSVYETTVAEGKILVRPVEKIRPTKSNRNYTFRCVRLDTGAEIPKPKRAADLFFRAPF